MNIIFDTKLPCKSYIYFLFNFNILKFNNNYSYRDVKLFRAVANVFWYDRKCRIVGLLVQRSSHWDEKCDYMSDGEAKFVIIIWQSWCMGWLGLLHVSWHETHEIIPLNLMLDNHRIIKIECFPLNRGHPWSEEIQWMLFGLGPHIIGYLLLLDLYPTWHSTPKVLPLL